MDDLVRKVGSIDLSLNHSKTSLFVTKRNATKDIGSDVTEIRNALKQSNQELEHVNDEIRALLGDVDKRTKKEVVDLRPQVAWLRTNVGSIVTSLEKAESKASVAMHESMSFQSSVADIEQEIAIKRRELDDATKEGAGLKSQAVSDKESSLRLIWETEEEIEEKDRSIRAKTNEASALRSELSTQWSQLSSLNTDLQNAQQRAKRKKSKAWGGGLMAVGGVLLAPVTGGASLVLTAGAAGYGTVKAIEYDEIKDQMQVLRSRISTTEGGIRSADGKVAELGAEKSSLESRLRRLKTTLQSEEAARARSQKEIDRADKLTSDIDSLQQQAQAASNEARESVRELGALKSKLHEVAAQINKEATQLTIGTTDVAGDGRAAASKRLQQRNRAAIASVAGALSNAQQKIPAMLSTSGMQFLTAETKKEQILISSIAISRMPSITKNSV